MKLELYGPYTGFWGYSCRIVTKTSDRPFALCFHIRALVCLICKTAACDEASCVNMAIEAQRDKVTCPGLINGRLQTRTQGLGFPKAVLLSVLCHSQNLLAPKVESEGWILASSVYCQFLQRLAKAVLPQEVIQLCLSAAYTQGTGRLAGNEACA